MTKVAGQSSRIGTLLAATDLRLSQGGAARDFALYELVTDGAIARTDRVSRLIEAGFYAPDDAGPNWSMTMSMTDRQIALFRLAFALGQWPAWFNSPCGACGEGVDLRVGSDEFEITPAPGPIPSEIDLDADGNTKRFAVPTGVQEQRIEADPDLGLTELCALDPIPVEDTRSWDLVFETALEHVLPSFEPELSFVCPECGGTSGWWFDPLDWIAQHSAHALAEVDVLARTYGWSEAEIFALPDSRRRMYLDIIEARA